MKTFLTSLGQKIGLIEKDVIIKKSELETVFDNTSEKTTNILESVDKIDLGKIIEELKNLLGDKYQEIIGSEEEVICIEKESFQSLVFERANFKYLPEKYGNADRFVYTIDIGENKKAIYVTGKVSSGNPFEVRHASNWSGSDNRKQDDLVYICEGNYVIEENQLTKGEKESYKGLDVPISSLRMHIDKSLGKLVNTEIVNK